MKGWINNSNIKLSAEKSVGCSSSTIWKNPHQRICTAMPCSLELTLCMKNCRSAMQRTNWFVPDLWQLPGD